MKKVDEVLAQLAAHGVEAAAAGRELADSYEAELDQVTGHLSQVYEELMLLYDIGSEIGATLDPNDIADRAVARMHELFLGAQGLVVLEGEGGTALPLGSQPAPDAAGALVTSP